MQYPFFDFPFYHPKPDIDLNTIYPIGSIIFRSSPLANKTEWTEVSLFNSQFTVEWEGMTWELIVSIKPSDLDDPTSPWVDFHSDVHSIRNVRLQYSRTPEELSRGVCSAKMVIDDQSTRVFNLDTFTGENSHKLITSEMPYHSHTNILGVADPSKTAKIDVDYNGWTNGYYYPSYHTGGIGGDQPHNNKEYAYNLFMYKRIA